MRILYHKWSIKYWKLKDSKKKSIRKVVQYNGLLLLLLLEGGGRRRWWLLLFLKYHSSRLDFFTSFHRFFFRISSPNWMRKSCWKLINFKACTQMHTHTRICLVCVCFFLFEYGCCMLTAPESPFFPFIFVELWKLPAAFFFFHLRILLLYSLSVWNVENGIKSDMCVCCVQCTVHTHALICSHRSPYFLYSDVYYYFMFYMDHTACIFNE